MAWNDDALKASKLRLTKKRLFFLKQADLNPGAAGAEWLKDGVQAIDLLQSALAERDATIERLEKENEELRDAPWPEWATAVLKVIRKHSGYDGYDDALDGVDLPSELEELMSELEQQAERNLAEARAEREVEQHKASTDHYRLKASEQRARAETAERERGDARAEVERLDKLLDETEDAMDRARSELLLVSQDPKYARNVAKDDRRCVDAATCILNAAIHEIEHAALTAKGGENAEG